MKNYLLIASALLAALGTTAVRADELMIGGRAGMVDYDNLNTDAGISGIFTLGYEVLDLGGANLAVEGELSLPFVDTEVNGVDQGFESVGAFAAFRTAGPVYFIGRAGVVNGDIDLYTDDTEPALGVGVGFSGIGLDWEVQYNAYDVEGVDVDIISVGLLF